MKLIAITGSIGSGKTTVLKLLEKRGFPVLSADEMARESVDSQFELVVEKLQAPQIQNRKDLRDWAFESAQNLEKLENIVHPMIRESVDKKKEDFKKQGHKICFYEVPILFEKKLESFFDFIVLVSSSEEERKKRLLERGLDEKDIKKIMSFQISFEEAQKKSDFIIENKGLKKEDLEPFLEELLKKLENLKC